MRLLLRDGATFRSSAQFEALLMQLRAAGIPIAGCGRVGEVDEAILIGRDSDADRAIAILAMLGIDARQG